MAEENTDIKKMIEQLEQERDELILQLHLGKAEAKDSLAELEQKWETLKQENPKLAEAEESLNAEWEALEAKWAEMKEQGAAMKETVEDVSQNVGAALDMAGDELKRGYERLRELL
jgi:predicted nuclease with TOPRIM domain